jgi:hypothetical protein
MGRFGIMRRLGVCGVLVVLGCGSARAGSSETGAPVLTLPARFAEGQQPERRPAQAEPETVAEAPSAPTHAPLPDPEALRTPDQWEYTFRYDHGDVRVEQVRHLRFEQPVVTARSVGRFAVELWIGRELIDRVRFDFPLLAGEPVPAGRRRPLDEPPTLLPGADTARTVLVPQSARATRAVLVDRATGATRALPWPPDAPLDP